MKQKTQNTTGDAKAILGSHYAATASNLTPLLKESGIKPTDGMLGHIIGEFVAVIQSGIFIDAIANPTLPKKIKPLMTRDGQEVPPILPEEVYEPGFDENGLFATDDMLERVRRIHESKLTTAQIRKWAAALLRARRAEAKRQAREAARGENTQK